MVEMRKEAKATRDKIGFTIVELLIVIIVIAILAAITVVAYTGITGRANDASVQTDLRQIATKLQAYAASNNGVYPQSDAEVQTLGIKVNKSAYGGNAVAGSNTYNLFYCRPQADPNKFALLASSTRVPCFSLSMEQLQAYLEQPGILLRLLVQQCAQMPASLHRALSTGFMKRARGDPGSKRPQTHSSHCRRVCQE